MKTGIKVLSTVCGLIILIGLALIIIGLAFGGNFNSAPTEEVTHEVSGEFSEIEIKSNTSDVIDVIIRVSESGKCYAVCDESDRIKCELTNENGILRLIENDERKWYDRIGIFFGGRDAVLYLPEGVYTSLKIEISSGNINCTDTALTFKSSELQTTSGSIKYAGNTEVLTAETASGSISISDSTVKKAELSLSSGSIKIVNTAADDIEAETSSGGITLDNVRATETIVLAASSGKIQLTDVISENVLRLEATSGSIIFSDCDGKDIYIQASSGNIKGTVLTGKTYDVSASSGSTSYPDKAFPEGGTFKARTSSGSIKIELSE